MSTLRYRVVQEITRRLATIQVVNSFATDAGLNILLGELPMFGPDDPDQQLLVMVGSDEPGHQLQNVCYVLPVEVQAILRATAVQTPLLTMESIIGDIKTAIEVDHNLAGLAIAPNGLRRGRVRVLEREPGSEFIGVGVGYDVELAEKWGAP